ncbi:hypothetical protein [Arthrobacter sp. efr-133-R2A-120]|uniref:hypothetical protein n=1 Tax=Arthrobacter sp. efr-133-R2A-120 TaxID=3040277 RepID=UPI002549E5AB|nr:hypothetical protein [Arthrobacter sp. efr-133-R2A-120]
MFERDLGVLERVPDDVQEYRRRVLKRIIPAWVCSVLNLLAMWVVSSSQTFSERFSFRSIPGESLLAGFGLLATLVVAVQVHARSLRRSDKRNKPGPAEFLGWVCWVILLAVTGLTTLGVAQSFDFSRFPSFPTFNVLHGLGSLVFGVLIALFASDAAEHAKLLEAQSEAYRWKEIRDTETLLKGLPSGRPAVASQTVQLLVLFVGCPVLCGMAGWLWFGVTAAFAGAVASPLLGWLAFSQLRKLCVLWYAKKPWPLLGNLAMGVLLWLLFAAVFLEAGLQLAIDGSLGADGATIVKKLFRFMAFYVLLTSLPFYVAIWGCRTYGAGRMRGIVIESAMRTQARRLLELRNIPVQRRLSLVATTRRANDWLKQHEHAFKKLRPIHIKLSLVLLILLGATVAAGVTWLVVFGPPTLFALFPDE